jgi:CBS domain containing-hemolysin-like protein
VTLGVAILWAVVSLVLAGALGSAARALGELSRQEVEEECRRRKLEPLAVEILQRHEQVALGLGCLVLICDAICLAAIYASVLAWQPAAEWSGWARFGLAALKGSAALVISNFWAPRLAEGLFTPSIVCWLWPLLRKLSALAIPLVAVTRAIERRAEIAGGRKPDSQAEASLHEELREIVAEGHREGLLEEEAREMIEGVIQLGDADVSQVMTPRTYMSSLQVGLPLDEALRFVISSGHTRIPVYDKSRDEIIGILHMKDLLPELVKPPAERAENVSQLLRPALFVPDTKRLDALLEEFQQNRSHMAVVLDEYGGVCGLVTIEDVLEEIVGEIVDEYDDDLVDGIKNIDDRTSEALARVRIDEVNERLSLHLPEDGDFDTIGGFVFSHLGHIPSVGEQVTIDDVRLTVMDVTRRRIERVRIEVLDPSQREMA